VIKSIILEDEMSARDVLNSYIEKTTFIQCLGTYESGLDIPLELLSRADLLFLDIQLPEINGLSYLKTLAQPPQVIVTTAHPEHAIDAFEVAVVDYLLKPFSYDRFCRSINRIRGQQETKEKDTSVDFILYADKTKFKINSKDILYLKAEVDYVRVVTTKQQILILDSLHKWEDKLKDLPFCRSHRSFIVNVKHIDRVMGSQVMVQEILIPIGRTYKQEFLGIWNKSIRKSR